MNKQKYQRWQDNFIQLRSNKIFELFVVVIIIFSALLVGAKTYRETFQFNFLISLLDWAVTIFFVCEIVIRMLAERRFLNFFKSGWNVFDFVIVVASLIPIDGGQSVLLARLLRVFRVLRLISIVPELRILMNAFLSAIPRMSYIALFMFIIFYIYGAIGSFIFHDINPFYWENVSVAMLTLFRIATFESWTSIMYETMEVYPLSWLFYLSFIFLSAFVFLNMMIGVVLEVMQEESKIEKQLTHPESENHSEINEVKQQLSQIQQQLTELQAQLRSIDKE